MESNFDTNDTPQYAAATNSLRPKNAPSPLSVLLLCLAFFLAGQLVSGFLAIGLAKAYGMDFQSVYANVDANSPLAMRNLMRATLFLNHLFSFIVPAFLVVHYAYKNLWVNYLRLDKKPTLIGIMYGVIWFIVSVPLIQVVYRLNRELRLPQWMLNLEQGTGNLMEGIVAQTHFYEIVVNVLLIGVLPAISEELVFRGIVQQQIGRFFKSEHVTVWLAAAIFSAIHMQFQGFFARLLLGVLLGYAFVWTRSLWVPMILHGLNNGAQIIGIYALSIKPADIDKMSDADKMPLWAGALSLVAAVMLGIYMRKTLKKEHSTDEIAPHTEGVT